RGSFQRKSETGEWITGLAPSCVTAVSRRAAERVLDDLVHAVELGLERRGERELAERASLMMQARAPVAGRIPAEIALLQRIRAKARGELDGDRQGRGRDRGPFGACQRTAGCGRVA